MKLRSAFQFGTFKFSTSK